MAGDVMREGRQRGYHVLTAAAGMSWVTLMAWTWMAWTSMRDGASRAGRMTGRNVRNAGRNACIFAGKVRNVGHMTGRKVRNVGHNACLFVGKVRKMGHGVRREILMSNLVVGPVVCLLVDPCRSLSSVFLSPHVLRLLLLLCHLGRSAFPRGCDLVRNMGHQVHNAGQKAMRCYRVLTGRWRRGQCLGAVEGT